MPYELLSLLVLESLQYIDSHEIAMDLNVLQPDHGWLGFQTVLEACTELDEGAETAKSSLDDSLRQVLFCHTIGVTVEVGSGHYAKII